MAIRREDVADFIRNIKHGEFAHIEFIKSNGELRRAIVQFGVKNPANATPPGKGQWKGKTFEESLTDGVVKFYEPHKDNGNGTFGAYRSAKIANIIAIKSRGIRHEII